MASDPRMPEEQRIVVTGFGPFPGVPENLSERLVREIEKRTPAVHEAIVDCIILPTEWAVTGEQIRTIVAARPAALVHFGVARHERGLRLEQYAYNECSDRADARGDRHSEATVIDGAPNCLETPVAVDRLHGDLQMHGLPALISSDPGRYICNQTYFQSLHAAGESKPHIPVLFVHIPRAVDGPDQDSFAELVKSAGLVLSHMARLTGTNPSRHRSQSAKAAIDTAGTDKTATGMASAATDFTGPKTDGPDR